MLIGNKKLIKYNHYPVLLKETIDALDCKKGLIYVDATLGGGGHSFEIAKRIYPEGRLISFDVDPDAIEESSKKLEPYKDIVTIVKANYSQIPEKLLQLNIPKITGGIVFDLGASYHQFMKAEKGFSFSKEASLDMRFDPESPVTAYDIINNKTEHELRMIFQEYGEERFSRRIAKKIVEKRKEKTIKTTTELADLIKYSVPKTHTNIHPATRVFQAIRISVNNELLNFENTLRSSIPMLEKSAKIVIISFHSLEDRLVKNLFKYYSSNCKCKREQLICNCSGKELEIITKKPITASPGELRENPPSRSAKLRVSQKI